MKFMYLILFILPFKMFAQNGSEEEKAYYSVKHYIDFKPVDSSKILSFSSFGVAIRPIPDFTPFTERDVNNVCGRRTDSADLYPFNIEDAGIIGQAENQHMRVMVYTDDKYDDLFDGGWGVWIAFYNKEQKTGGRYYTGLSQNIPLFLKCHSRLPLIKNDSTLQLEAALLQLAAPMARPISLLKYALIKDGLLVEMNLNRIMLDSDGDGLTDIEEDKMMLDPHNPDTDGDGIPDLIDASPRKHSPRTDKSIVYETIIGEAMHRPIPDSTLQGLPANFRARVSDSLLTLYEISERIDARASTVIIVSDSPDILGIQKSNNRLIIMTEDEYRHHRDKYQSTFDKFFLSPLFKVDHSANIYTMHASFGPGSITYSVQKTERGWVIKSIGGGSLLA